MNNSPKAEVSTKEKMPKKPELIRREFSYFNNCICSINNLKLDLAEKGNSSLCLKAEVPLPLIK